MTRILVVDDHFIVRKGLVSILAEMPEPVEAEEAESGEEALEKVEGGNFDLVLLDIALPGKRGLEVLKELQLLYPKLPVLMLSMHPEEQYAVQSLRSGACGYLNKGSAADELILAIQKVLSGGKVHRRPACREARLRPDQQHREAAARDPLHPRVPGAAHDRLGQDPRTIAKEMGLNVKTVNTFRARLLHKMMLSSNVELTRYAIEHHLIE